MIHIFHGFAIIIVLLVSCLVNNDTIKVETKQKAGKNEHYRIKATLYVNILHLLHVF